jgi:hypothetical protein
VSELRGYSTTNPKGLFVIPGGTTFSLDNTSPKVTDDENCLRIDIYQMAKLFRVSLRSIGAVPYSLVSQGAFVTSCHLFSPL